MKLRTKIAFNSNQFLFLFSEPHTSPPQEIKPKHFMKGLQLPSDFSAELKSRLRKSTNASVSNLKKSASSIDAIRHVEPPSSSLLPSLNQSKVEHQTSSASSSDTEEGKDLGKLLRSVSKENMNSVKRGLMNLNKMLEHSASMGVMSSGAVSTSDGESSGGREVATIIKNSAVARRKKFNEG